MGTLQHIQQWSATHHPRWLIIVRIALGLCLFIKGISFMNNAVFLSQLLAGSVMSKSIDWLPLLITWVHLLGGFLIIVGLLTRWAVLIQIPILIGAVVFTLTRRGSFSDTEPVFALVILLLLCFFLIEGSGPLSLDNYFQKNKGNVYRGL
jgi:uncharacterized membrane protein YphA (DoxX/SURF4 family)